MSQFLLPPYVALRLSSPHSRVLLLLPLLLVLLTGCSERKRPVPPMPELPVVVVIQRDQAISLEMVGETRGSSDVPIRARVDGFLESMDFVEGRNVEKGDLLYRIDENPYKTKVAEAQGRQAEAQTALSKAKADLDRLRPLAAIKAISQMDLDAAVAQYQAAQGTVQSANAQVKQAQILLGYCRVYAPISGRIGISQVEVGEYVGGAGNGLLNLVSQVDPIRVRFAIDEKSYLKIARKMSARRKTPGLDKEPRKPAELVLILADGSLHKPVGHIVTTNAVVDSTTGTFTLEADFPNPDRVVLAGQFARIRTDIESLKDALLVPQRSIVELQGNFSVFVVDTEGKVEQRKVLVGAKINRLQLITSGLQPGEKVVLEGVQKLRSGMSIKPLPSTFEEIAHPSSAKPSGV